MKILKLDLKEQKNWPTIIDSANKVIRQGGLVIYPTETVYGIGADPHNPEAIAKLLKYKSRREGKPMSIAVVDQKMATSYVEINQQATSFYDRFLPGPFTVVSKLNPQANVDPQVASEFKTLGIRIPDFPFILVWLKKLGQGITSTSANASGKKRPYAVSDIFNNLSEKQKSLVDLVIDAGQLSKNDPSTVIDTTLSAPLALRGKIDQGKFTKFASKSETETKDLAARLVLKNWNRVRKSGLIFGLNGQLGVGKTIFAKGVAKFLKIDEEITSPTYSYLNEYDFKRHQTKGVFYHLDAWKIDCKEEVEFLEIENLLKKNNIIVIEWWQQIAAYLPKEVKEQAIILDISQNKEKRQIKLWQ